jgi:hypothetical protein
LKFLITHTQILDQLCLQPAVHARPAKAAGWHSERGRASEPASPRNQI